MMRRSLAVCVLLVLGTLVVYRPVAKYNFVTFDDDHYVYENPRVRGGLDWSGVSWAFTTTWTSNWHPLTWLSHMLDSELFGLNAGRHHFVSVVLHILNTVLLFLVLKGMTRALWRSAMVAALFALHPLHVESVAWVSERKDILSSFFFMLMLWAYVRYVACPSWSRLGLVFVFLSFGLMSKPMLVTAPFVLLLLDYWPLQRFQVQQVTEPGGTGRIIREAQGDRVSNALWLVAEKLPLFAVAAASCVVTFVAQGRGSAMLLTSAVPLGSRIANALVAYVSYIGKTLWPGSLAVFYPYRPVLPTVEWVGAALLLSAISVLVVLGTRRWQYLLVGWLWYLGMLVPVIGLVQVGQQCMADRYTYLPLIGIFLIAVWGVADLAAGRRRGRIAMAGAAGTVILACMVGTRHQVRHWRNGVTLFEHALEVTKDNSLAHNNLGMALMRQGRPEEAIVHYRQAIAHYRDAVGIAPIVGALAHYNLGVVRMKQGKTEEAIRQFREALQIRPEYPEAHTNLGLALISQGKRDEGVTHYREALRIHPESIMAHLNLGVVLAREGKHDKAIAHFRKALEIDPRSAEAHTNLGLTLISQGKSDEGITHYREALRIRPELATVHNNLALELAKRGNDDEAIAHYREAVRIRPEYAEAHFGLGVMLARQGRQEEAVPHFRQASRINPRLVSPYEESRPASITQGQAETGMTHDGEASQKDLNAAEARHNLGIAKARQGNVDEAAAHFREALRLDPGSSESHASLAMALSSLGNLDEAIVHYREAIRLKPEDPKPYNNLAWIRATHPDPRLRDGSEAVELGKRACELSHRKDPNFLDTLAAGYAEAGQFSEAIATLKEAIALAVSLGSKESIPDLERRLEGYKQGRPYREHHPQ
jgi:tetratricopeptide (TPR) repeat protein